MFNCRFSFSPEREIAALDRLTGMQASSRAATARTLSAAAQRLGLSPTGLQSVRGARSTADNLHWQITFWITKELCLSGHSSVTSIRRSASMRGASHLAL